MSTQSVLTRRPVRATPDPADGAGRAGTLRILGSVGVAAGLLFGAMAVWQHAAGLDSDGAGAAVAINQVGFTLAMAGYLALGVGLYLARPGGNQRSARVFPGLLAASWTALLAGMTVDLLADVGEGGNVLLPIGGLAQGIGLLGLGITTVAARRWAGWRRYWALGFAIVFAGAIFGPAIAGIEPGVMTEVVWALGYSGLGYALLGGQPAPRTRVLLGGAVVALLGAATVVAFTSGPDGASARIAPVVEDSRVFGSADGLERQVESEPRFGSADVLERQGETLSRYGSADTLERQAA